MYSGKSGAAATAAGSTARSAPGLRSAGRTHVANTSLVGRPAHAPPLNSAEIAALAWTEIMEKLTHYLI